MEFLSRSQCLCDAAAPSKTLPFTNGKLGRLSIEWFARMKTRIAALTLGLLAIVLWTLFAPTGRMGQPVHPSRIPPPVTVLLKGTNLTVRVIPGVGGALIVLSDGTLWRWGGQSSSLPRVVAPQQVGTDVGWTDGFVANNHCVGLRADGTLWEWGYCGDQKATRLPVQVGEDRDWAAVAAGDVHAVALKRDGTLWGWGDNSMQQLGHGCARREPAPVQLDTSTNWKAIACGQGSHTLGLRADGTLWVWGKIFGFENGAPGASFPVPTQICRDTNWIGLVAGPVAHALTLTPSGVWSPLNSPPNAALDAASVCRLISSNSVPGRSASAFCGRPEIYEVRPEGTLWGSIYPFGPWAKASPRWFQVGQRSDWINIWGFGSAIGQTADGTLWLWGQDDGQEPVLDFQSKYKLLKARVWGWFGIPTGNTTTSAISPYQKEPRPLMHLVPENQR